MRRPASQPATVAGFPAPSVGWNWARSRPARLRWPVDGKIRQQDKPQEPADPPRQQARLRDAASWRYSRPIARPASNRSVPSKRTERIDLPPPSVQDLLFTQAGDFPGRVAQQALQDVLGIGA